jgi:hypothetical protein
MVEEDSRAAYSPPEAPLDAPAGPAKQPQTVGYLIGAIVQLALGGYLTYGGLTGSVSAVILVVGIVLLVLGARAVRRYRRSRRAPQ